jgi:FlaA1/EpsC-like NDP-sugar epimerase
MCLISVSYCFSYALRFAEEFRTLYYGLFVTSLPIVIACQLAGFLAAGVYRGLWRYVSLGDLFTYVRGVLFGGQLTVLALLYLYRFEHYSRGVFMINAIRELRNNPRHECVPVGFLDGDPTNSAGGSWGCLCSARSPMPSGSSRDASRRWSS